MQKLLTIFLTASLLCNVCLTGDCAGGNVCEDCDYAEIGETIGYVEEIDGDIAYVVGEPPNSEGFCEVLVKIGDAPVYDLRTGFRTGAGQIKRDTDIRVAYVVPCCPTDAPYEAVVVWLNWDDDDAAVFTVTSSENLQIDADGAVFLSTNGKYRVALTAETEIFDGWGRRLSHREIEPGMEFFVWVDIVTASTPALVFPEKVVAVE